MADENNDPVPQSAIPPKAVPPQVRPNAETGGAADSPTVRRQQTPYAGGSAAPVPRTVRLKPIGVPQSADASAAATPVPTHGPAAAEDAADAIKRMTARIAMMSGDVDPVTGKKRTGRIGDASAKKTTGSLAAMSVSEDEATIRKMTSRIQMPATTVPIPDVTDVPRTIKIRPMTGTQPMNISAPGTLPGKAKTSRIPLESAMSVPQSGGGSDSTSGGTPKTIKLKRPGEMATIKVAVPSASMSAASASGGDHQSDGTPITQKKTIRVKRPTAPAAGPGESSTSIEASSSGGMVGMTPVAFAPPERGLGWFVAVAVACILLGIGLVGLFYVQSYGSRPHTELDTSFQHG